MHWKFALPHWKIYCIPLTEGVLVSNRIPTRHFDSRVNHDVALRVMNFKWNVNYFPAKVNLTPPKGGMWCTFPLAMQPPSWQTWPYLCQTWLTAWSTKVLCAFCQAVTKRHNWHIDNISVILFCHGWGHVLNILVLQGVKCAVLILELIAT